MKSHRESLNKKLAELSHARRRVTDEEKELNKARLHLDACKEAHSIVQSVSQSIQQGVHARMASIVSRCLETVFKEDAYSFGMVFERKRGRTEVTFTLTKGDVILDDPTREAGGGVVDICAFALRLASLMMSRPKKRKFLCLDEPLRNLNGEIYQDRVGELLMALSKEFKVQMVIASDDDWLRIGKVIDLGQL